MLEPGDYLGSIAEAVATFSKQKRTPCLLVTFNVHYRSGYDTDNTLAWLPLSAPVRAYVYIWLSDNAKASSKQKLEALGFDGNFDNPAFSHGDEVQLRMDHEEYDGKVREKWELSNWGDGPEKLPADQTRQLSTWWKATSTPPAKPAGRPRMPSSPTRIAVPANNESTDDDIGETPF